ncbi:cytochrome-c peroxidase [Limnospira platensis CENA597]|uniref:cytochrome-c peroxidase n=2 Tax=Oscillatoriales TaxID=1150 RepID=UPI003D6E4B35
MLMFVKFILSLLIIFGVIFSVEQPVLSANDPEHTYLDMQLRQLINSIAPNNSGYQYFILPDSENLSAIPFDPQNELTKEKIDLGQMLFHETALSINPINSKHWQEASCASCHFAEAGFRSNLPQALGTGGIGAGKLRHPDPDAFPAEIDKQNILAPSVLNSAYQKAMLWNGRAGSTGVNGKEKLIQSFDINRFKLDGLETQAISAMNVHKLGTAAIALIPEYQKLFASAFPDRPYVGSEVEDLKRAGLAIAAYERTLLSNEAPFQKWLKGNKMAMSKNQIRGAITFFSSSCVHCHTGPNLARDEFYAVGFDDHPKDWTGLNLGRGTATQRAKDDFKFKVPQLYNLIDSSPYGHGASFTTVRQIVEYFNNAKPQKMEAKYSGNLSIFFKPLNLTNKQVDDLTYFVETGLRDPNLIRYVPSKIPSSLCFPNNDDLSRKQLNCD